MFVKLMKTAATALFATLLSGAAMAGEVHSPVNLTVNNVKAEGGPLYISIQTEETYMANRGTSGGVYKHLTNGTMSFQYTDVPPGEYAISLWHDIDNDGRFSMNENYVPTDGWGTTGTMPRGKPTFDDVKMTIPQAGADVVIDLVYP